MKINLLLTVLFILLAFCEAGLFGKIKQTYKNIERGTSHLVKGITGQRVGKETADSIGSSIDKIRDIISKPIKIETSHDVNLVINDIAQIQDMIENISNSLKNAKLQVGIDDNLLFAIDSSLDMLTNLSFDLSETLLESSENLKDGFINVGLTAAKFFSITMENIVDKLIIVANSFNLNSVERISSNISNTLFNIIVTIVIGGIIISLLFTKVDRLNIIRLIILLIMSCFVIMCLFEFKNNKLLIDALQTKFNDNNKLLQDIHKELKFLKSKTKSNSIKADFNDMNMKLMTVINDNNDRISSIESNFNSHQASYNSVLSYLIPFKKTFKYNSEPFKGGLFEYFRNTLKMNPHDAGEVRVTASTVHSGSPSSIVGGISDNDYHTLNSPNSWIQVDLGNGKRMTVDYYCLRNRVDNQQFPRYWYLEGSVTGNVNDFKILREHNNDNILVGPRSTFCWSVDPISQDNQKLSVTTGISNDSNVGFRYFRIHQFDKNSNGADWFVFSAMELYGTITISKFKTDF